MNVLAELEQRTGDAILRCVGSVASSSLKRPFVVQSQDPKFGDYQINCAMQAAKIVGMPPREVAAGIVAALDVADMCQPPEIAGPGFINLRLRGDWLAAQLRSMVTDPRLGVAPTADPMSFVVDYSAPNVAKAMHVGHIRSTVIGDAIYRTLKFLGHAVIGDNHLGDWGTQFGMILYGYKHFVDSAAYQANPVEELGRLYRLVNTVVEYFDAGEAIATLEAALAKQHKELEGLQQEQAAADDAAKKKADKALKAAENRLATTRGELEETQGKRSAFEQNAALQKIAAEHPDIRQQVLAETAKLHAGDEENVRLWREFMPYCLESINEIYHRLGVTFDVTLGESFYHDRLAGVVTELKNLGVAEESDGAVCIFVDSSAVDMVEPPPLLIRKKDGAFLYGTTDLATIWHRVEDWAPAEIVYVVDHRQSLHFQLLFGAAKKWFAARKDWFERRHQSMPELKHIAFGTVLGNDGRPFKTRAGDTVGLSGLLDEAVSRAHKTVSENDDAKPDGPELSADQRRRIAESVGIAALKYADLSQNRTSDYVFSYEKMLAMSGNTATYMQYAYARVRSIFRRGNIDVGALRASGAAIALGQPAERALALELLRFSEALESMLADYRPNQLTSYLFDLANRYSTFFEQCPVLKAESADLRASRLLLCDLTARTTHKGLELLGIQVVEQM